MAPQTIVRFPDLKDQVKRLVQAHRKLKDEPLLLAVYYAPKRNPKDVFLFEVAENFGGGRVDKDRKLFEVTYRSTDGFPMAPGQQLRLVLTNPIELDEAVKGNWKHVQELREAFSRKRTDVLFEDTKKGPQLRRLLFDTKKRPELVSLINA